MEIDLVDNILTRLLELPIDVQKKSLENAAIIMENWNEISDSLTSRAIELEFYEVCAILRDI
jgi:hypothetical protein